VKVAGSPAVISWSNSFKEFHLQISTQYVSAKTEEFDSVIGKSESNNHGSLFQGDLQ